MNFYIITYNCTNKAKFAEKFFVSWLTDPAKAKFLLVLNTKQVEKTKNENAFVIFLETTTSSFCHKQFVSRCF